MRCPFLRRIVAHLIHVTLYSEGRGHTVFAPNEAAMLAINGLEDQLNFTQMQNVLSNHVGLTVQRQVLLLKSMLLLSYYQVINSSTVYVASYPFNYTSAAGERLNLSINATGSYVTSGNITARILSADMPMPNGVVHIIDRVLANADGDPTAAEAAYHSIFPRVKSAQGGALLTAPFSDAVVASAVAIFGIFIGAAAIY